MSCLVCLPYGDLWGSLGVKLVVVDWLCQVGLLQNVAGCRDGGLPEEIYVSALGGYDGKASTTAPRTTDTDDEYQKQKMLKMNQVQSLWKTLGGSADSTVLSWRKGHRK